MNDERITLDVYTDETLDAMPEPDETAEKSIYYLANHEKYSRIIWLTENKFHSHAFWEMFVVLRGVAVHHTLTKIEPISSGSLYLLPPTCKHYIEIPTAKDKNKETYIHRDFYISNEKMQNICNGLAPDLYNKLCNLKEPLSANLHPRHLEHLEDMIFYYLHNEKDFNFSHTVFVTHLLTFLLAEMNYTNKQYPRWINTLLDNLNKEEFMSQPMKEIISSTGYSQGYVCRTFKKYMHSTLTAYIKQVKCNYSCSLLKNPDICNSEISYRLNFSDESAYIAAFKKYYGITPGQWRKKDSSRS